MSEKIGHVPPEVIAAEQAKITARNGQPVTVEAGVPIAELMNVGQVESLQDVQAKTKSQTAEVRVRENGQTQTEQRVGEPVVHTEDRADGPEVQNTETRRSGTPDAKENIPGQQDAGIPTASDRQPTKDGTVDGSVVMVGRGGEAVVFQPGTRDMTPDIQQPVSVGRRGGRGLQEARPPLT